jgi:hypothetical protein
VFRIYFHEISLWISVVSKIQKRTILPRVLEEYCATYHTSLNVMYNSYRNNKVWTIQQRTFVFCGGFFSHMNRFIDMNIRKFCINLNVVHIWWMREHFLFQWTRLLFRNVLFWVEWCICINIRSNFMDKRKALLIIEKTTLDDENGDQMSC